MYQKICKYISSKFLQVDIIKLEDQEVFEFGLETFISKLFTICLLFLTGFIFKNFLESILFYFCFKYSRKHAGGYHASTYTKCNTFYIITFILCLLGSNLISNNAFTTVILIAIIIFVLVTVVLFAPINNPNNPILPTYESIFFIKSILTNLLIIIGAIVLKLMNLSMWSFLICTIFTSAIYMHIEIIKRREWNMKSIKRNLGEKFFKLIMKNAEGSIREVSSAGIYQTKRPEVLTSKKESK